MSAKNFIGTVLFIAAVFLQLFSNLQVDCKAKQEEFFNYTEFEVLSNRSVESLDESLQLVLNCSSIFSVSEIMRHIKICAAEELEFHDTVQSKSRSRREVYLGEPFASDPAADDEDEPDSFENIQDSDKDKQRIIRGILISNDKLRAHLPWKWLESRSIRETPCIAACVLEELQVLNDTTDIPDRPMIVKRISEIVTNVSSEKAESIADRCIDGYKRNVDKIQPSKGEVEIQRCRAAVNLAICLSKKSYEFCKEDPNYKPITVIAKPRPKTNDDD